MSNKETLKEALIRKLTSRKLWIAVASFASLITVASGHTENEAATVTALIMAGATVIAYIVGEGLVDASNVDIDEEE